MESSDTVFGLINTHALAAQITTMDISHVEDSDQSFFLPDRLIEFGHPK